VSPRTAAVIVTHNSEKFLPALLASIASQTQQPDVILAIDDNSTDRTIEILNDQAITVHPATTTATDTTTRIAQNFVQGVQLAMNGGAEIVILSDHDDTWHRNRVQHQVAFLDANPTTAFLASDGNTTGTQTIRSTFPVPENFNDLPPTDQWRYAAKHSIATGGASALRPSKLSTITVPSGWLHDRWWSLRAVREHGIAIDPTVVIDYRISPDQQVGLDTNHQGNPITWALKKITQAPTTFKKMRDIANLLGEKKATR